MDMMQSPRSRSMNSNRPDIMQTLSSTMNRYRITYTEGSDGETETATFKGYDADHAVERFLDALDAQGGTEGIEVLSVVLIRQHSTVHSSRRRLITL